MVIALLVALSLAGWFIYRASAAEKPAKAEIYFESELVSTVALNMGEDKTFSIPQHEDVVFHLHVDGSIAFEQSDCPDKVCINAGRLSMVGQFAACLPNGIVLKIVPTGGRDSDDPDMVVGQ